jgi:hypothetical protein
MSLLIYAGLLYLLGVSIVLTLKPEFMFTKEGQWKEFGLGRNKQQYTWFPFWLFTIIWAILSYTIVLVITDSLGQTRPSNEGLTVISESIEPNNVSMKSLSSNRNEFKKPKNMGDMKQGYYILDHNETMKQGIPKYIFLGPEAPNLIYNHTLEQTNNIEK